MDHYQSWIGPSSCRTSTLQTKQGQHPKRSFECSLCLETKLKNKGVHTKLLTFKLVRIVSFKLNSKECFCMHQYKIERKNKWMRGAQHFSTVVCIYSINLVLNRHPYPHVELLLQPVCNCTSKKPSDLTKCAIFCSLGAITLFASCVFYCNF